jgi:hypothetical protein
LTKAERYSARSLRRQDAEQCTPCRHPGKGALENADGESAIEQIAHSEGGEGPVRSQIGAEQDAGGIDAGGEQNVLEKRRRHMQSRCRVADQRQRRAYVLEGIGIAANREMTSLPPRGRAHLGQVHRQSLLQLPCPARCDERGTGRTPAEVDQQARTIWL